MDKKQDDPKQEEPNSSEVKEDELLEPKKRKMPNWLMGILGIIATLLATWITIVVSENRSDKAEEERARNVKNGIVAIIEENIINQKPINFRSIDRMIKNRSEDEKLITIISKYDLLQIAEYNIQSSRYLDFELKNKYATLIDSMFYQLNTMDSCTFADSIPYSDLLGEISRSIQAGYPDTSLTLLNQYVTSTHLHKSL